MPAPPGRPAHLKVVGEPGNHPAPLPGPTPRSRPRGPHHPKVHRPLLPPPRRTRRPVQNPPQHRRPRAPRHHHLRHPTLATTPSARPSRRTHLSNLRTRRHRRRPRSAHRSGRRALGHRQPPTALPPAPLGQDRGRTTDATNAPQGVGVSTIRGRPPTNRRIARRAWPSSAPREVRGGVPCPRCARTPRTRLAGWPSVAAGTGRLRRWLSSMGTGWVSWWRSRRPRRRTT